MNIPVKIICLPIVIVLLLMSTSCEEDDSPILFAVEYNSNPGNTTLEYYSADPSCQPKSYFITTGYTESEITIKCTNQAAIWLEAYSADSSESDKQYTSEAGLWTASITDGNMIEFHFMPIPTTSGTDSGVLFEVLPVYATSKNGLVKTDITVLRFP